MTDRNGRVYRTGESDAGITGRSRGQLRESRGLPVRPGRAAPKKALGLAGGFVTAAMSPRAIVDGTRRAVAGRLSHRRGRRSALVIDCVVLGPARSGALIPGLAGSGPGAVVAGDGDFRGAPVPTGSIGPAFAAPALYLKAPGRPDARRTVPHPHPLGEEMA
ncbi:hypothetical protein [Streptomyces sp. NPDC047079]|uniref:hypothetical protein n=1 Tax=Streptomyces sp. NPDC047079 TaxID=3154607 RepID=UPI0033E052D6